MAFTQKASMKGISKSKVKLLSFIVKRILLMLEFRWFIRKSVCTKSYLSQKIYLWAIYRYPLALIFLFKEVGEDPGPVFPGAEACNLAGQVAVQDVFRLGLQEDGDAQELILDPAAAEKPLF